jgi:hypothetical protein
MVTLGPMAMDYLRLRLGQGRSLSRELSRHSDLERGVTFTLLPANVAESAAYQFERGIISESTRPPIHTVPSGLKIQAKPNSDAAYGEVLASRLAALPGSRLLIEDALAKPTDSGLARSPIPFWIFDDDVIFAVPHAADAGHIGAALSFARSWGMVAALTQVDGQPTQDSPVHLTAHQLISFAENASLILVEAYDGEGYIVWEKRQK